VNGVSDLMAFALRREAISPSMERGKKIYNNDKSEANGGR
jgi:hypothetical protein